MSPATGNLRGHKESFVVVFCLTSSRMSTVQTNHLAKPIKIRPSEIMHLSTMKQVIEAYDAGKKCIRNVGEECIIELSKLKKMLRIICLPGTEF